MLQQAILREYAINVGLNPDAHYYGGARLRPVVPLDTAIGGTFILGAYPSARFESVGRQNDVPVGDNLGPFEPERYFDGNSVRTQKSADELKKMADEAKATQIPPVPPKKEEPPAKDKR